MPQAISGYSSLSLTDSKTNNYLFGINSINKNKQNNISAAYAQKGEPMYQKDMDTDNDGIITMDEFKKYCDDNDISVSQRKQMLKDRINWHLQQQTQEKSKEIRKEEPKTEKIFAEKGDKNYKEEIDSDSDGKITYEEYIKYCEENSKKETSSKDKTTGIYKNQDNEVISKNKVIEAYSDNSTDSNIETEA